MIALVVNPLVEAISITIDEKMIGTISKDGDIGKFEVRGKVFLHVNDEQKCNAEIQLSLNNVKGVMMKPHPELNRGLWTSKKILAPKENSKGFPINVKLEALMYKYSTNNASDLPFNIVVWNASEGKLNAITLEAEFNAGNPRFTSIENLKISIPVAGTKQPEISKVENSETEYYPKEQTLEWSIDKLDANKTNSVLEFKTPNDVAAIFPIIVNVSYPYSILDAKIVSVQTVDTKEPISHDDKIIMTCENYQIVYEL